MKKLTSLFFLLIAGTLLSQPQLAKVQFQDGSEFEGYVEFTELGYTKFRFEENEKPSRFDGFDIKKIEFLVEPFNTFEYVFIGSKLKLLQNISEGDIIAYALFQEHYNDQITLDENERNDLKKLYKSTTNAGISNGNNSFPTILFRKNRFWIKRKEDETLIDLKSNFRKDASAIFTDCEGLTEKIKKREFKYKNMETVLHYYYDFCSDVYVKQ